MSEHAILVMASFLCVGFIVYIWLSQRNLIKNKMLTPIDYLWKLKCITGKSEFELFQIAAEEKGWPRYQVEGHFNRYLKDQTLPIYVKEFLEDGRDYINTYRPREGNFFNKRLVIFYSLFALVLIGGSFFICLWVLPRIWPSSLYYGNIVSYNSESRQAVIEQQLPGQ